MGRFLAGILLAGWIVASVSVHAAEVTRLAQGWSQQEAETAYHMDEGSQIMPLRWFLALELNSSGKKFNANSEAYGLIPSNTPVTGFHQLPLGLTEGEDARTTALYGEAKWVGVNCTACHSGLLEIGGRPVLIDGGQGLFDIQKFEIDLNSSVVATLKDSAQFDRFAKELGATDLGSLRKSLEQFSHEFTAWTDRNHHYYDTKKNEIQNGPGRIDGLGGATNDLICRFTDRLGNGFLKAAVTDSKNCRSAQPATSLPHLWGITEMEFVQWNGAVHSSLGRNFGQSTATYAKNWVEMGPGMKPKFLSTANVDNLYALEQLYQKLESPSWRSLETAGLVKALEPDRVVRGEKHFVQNCVACHAIQPTSTAPNSFGNSYWKVAITDQNVVGTDPSYMNASLARRAVMPAALEKYFKAAFGEQSVDAKGEVSATDFRAFTIGALVLEYFESLKLTPERRAQLTNCRERTNVQTRVGLRARSLEGVLFTAPYLHNGSVPTMNDLLKPAAERPKTFHVGCRKYDMVNMGYDCHPSTGAFLFDTTLETNGNQGHEYGTNLDPEGRLDLIEYMKSLEQPLAASPKNPACN